MIEVKDEEVRPVVGKLARELTKRDVDQVAGGFKCLLTASVDVGRLNMVDDSVAF